MTSFKQLRRHLERAGYQVIKSKRNSHYKVYYQGALINSMPCTTSDHRTLRNTLSQLRKAGAPV